MFPRHLKRFMFYDMKNKSQIERAIVWSDDLDHLSEVFLLDEIKYSFLILLHTTFERSVVMQNQTQVVNLNFLNDRKEIVTSNEKCSTGRWKCFWIKREYDVIVWCACCSWLSGKSTITSFSDDFRTSKLRSENSHFFFYVWRSDKIPHNKCI